METAVTVRTSLAQLAVRSGRSKDLQIIVARHENSVLRRQIGRPAINDDDRTLLGAITTALPNRSDVTWSEFLHSQAPVACDFFTVDTAFLRCYYVLFFIHVPTREVLFAGITANPAGT